MNSLSSERLILNRNMRFRDEVKFISVDRKKNSLCDASTLIHIFQCVNSKNYFFFNDSNTTITTDGIFIRMDYTEPIILS